MSYEKWALISVFNKDGVVEFAKRLVAMDWKIISSGGTAKKILEAGVPVKDVAELVGGAAILGHRVVTLSRQVHAGLLADAIKPEDLAELVSLNIPFIDLVRCDFYPLAEAIADAKATISSVVEKTDIGGPCMVRSGAKGMRIVICRPEDMEPVLQEMEQRGGVFYDSRQKLRARAEFEVAKYVGDSAMYHGTGHFKVIAGERVMELPKGENGHQIPAALYKSDDDSFALHKFTVLKGVPLSYNNLTDIDRLLQIVNMIDDGLNCYGWTDPYVIAAVVKHGNACGASFGMNDQKVVQKAVSGNVLSAFGGLLMYTLPVDEALAETMVTFNMSSGQNQKFDSVIAPAFTDGAIRILERKGGKCRIVKSPAPLRQLRRSQAPKIRQVRGGFLVQPQARFTVDFKSPDLLVFGKREPELEYDLTLAAAVGSTSNSNTITIVKDDMLIGNGVGQQDRVGAAELAISRAIGAGHGDKLKGAVAYSDSFFPFPDAPDLLIKEGIRAIFSTSGSVNDKLTQDLCVNNGVTLYQLPDAEARGFFGH